MLRVLTAFLVAVVAGPMLFGSANGASAHYRHEGRHGCCGPIPPTYVYNTVHAVKHVTRYRDVSRTKYVYRPHRIVHVTEVRPVIYIHSVTRIHHHIVGIVRPVYQHRTEYLPPKRIITHSVRNTYDCRCKARCE